MPAKPTRQAHVGLGQTAPFRIYNDAKDANMDVNMDGAGDEHGEDKGGVEESDSGIHHATTASQAVGSFLL